MSLDNGNGSGAPAIGAESVENSAAVEFDREDIPPTDITFDCPHCGQSLSIEPRGAGLVIKCTNCGRPVTVPIPEGLEIDDFDATPAELAAQLQSARKKLIRAEERVVALEEELLSLREVEAGLKRHDDDNESLLDILGAKLSDLAALQDKANALLKEIATLASGSGE